MIRSGDYQYVYGINRDPAAEKCAFYGCCVHKTYISPEPFEANTGYYYISAHNKSRAVRALFRAALSECARRPAMDDQTNFWNVLKRAGERARTGRRRPSFSVAYAYASGTAYWRAIPPRRPLVRADENATTPGTFQVCALPHGLFFTACGSARAYGEYRERIVVYHANCRRGGREKRLELQKLGYWSIIPDQAQGPAAAAGNFSSRAQRARHACVADDRAHLHHPCASSVSPSGYGSRRPP